MRLNCQRQRCSPRSVVSGDIRLMPIFVGVHWCQMRVRSSKIRSLYLPYEVPHWLYFRYRNLHGFARFLRDSTALVFWSYVLATHFWCFCWQRRRWCYDDRFEAHRLACVADNWVNCDAILRTHRSRPFWHRCSNSVGSLLKACELLLYALHTFSHSLAVLLALLPKSSFVDGYYKKIALYIVLLLRY